MQSRAALEERLLRFDEAIRSYTRLYELTYNDPQWLDKAAEFNARLGRRAEAIRTLERAHIGVGGETVRGLFAITEKLEEWHLYSDATGYAGRGYTMADSRIWTDYPEYADAYAKIVAESRHTDVLLAIQNDQSTGRRISALQTAGAALGRLYTPEEKAALAAKLSRPQWGTDDGVNALARGAGLEDILADSLRRQWTNGNRAAGNEWIELESRRGRYEELVRALEQIGDQPGDDATGSFLLRAAEAAKNAGDVTCEMRIYARLGNFGALSGPESERYLSLLLAHDPAELARLAGSDSEQLRNQVAQFTIANANERMALGTLRARSQALPPVWLSAYTAFTGVYFDDHSRAVNQAFIEALNPMNIGQRLAHRADPATTLIGSIWFYYGARYGESLARSGSAQAAGYLPSELELSPGDADAYLALARFYARVNQRHLRVRGGAGA